MSDSIESAQDQQAIDLAGTGEAITPEVTPVEQPHADSGGNPAWEPLKQKLDPLLFKSIESDLKDWDKSAQSRIESLNQQYAPFKQFADAGVKPEAIQQAIALAEMIDKDPVAIHQRLGEFLQQTGRMPQTQKEVAAVVDGAESEEEMTEDPRIAQLQAQQDQMQQFLQQQEEQRVQAQADQELSTEIAALRKAHPEMSDADQQEVLERAATIAWKASQSGQNMIPKLEDAYAQLAAYRNQILSAPRAGDSAPRLLPTSGGVPSPDQGKKSLGALSSNETVDLLAGLISGGRQS